MCSIADIVRQSLPSYRTALSVVWESIIIPFLNGHALFMHGLAWADLKLWVQGLFNPRLDRIPMLFSVGVCVPLKDNLFCCSNSGVMHTLGHSIHY